MNTLETVLEIKERVSRSIIGQEHVVERLILAILAGGNVLMEGLPGLAKTRAVKSLSNVIESDFSRIQFTPDLLPSDVTGTEIYYNVGGKGEFKFQPGPIFGNLILADEINRAPAKVQSALLEAMEEHQITVAGKTYKLPDFYMVLATQNPIEHEGTYPLPEAQMDRFLMHVSISYPDDTSERKIVCIARDEEKTALPTSKKGGMKSEDPVPQQVIFDARSEILEVEVSEYALDYIVGLIAATRRPEAFGDNLKQWILIGSSPRGTIALDKVSRAHAWLHGRGHVTPDDVRAVIHDCLRHRLVLTYEANAEGIRTDLVIDEIVRQVAVA